VLTVPPNFGAIGVSPIRNGWLDLGVVPDRQG
jgi:hypothetical protein